MSRIALTGLVIVAVAVAIGSAQHALADGSEMLGPPSISIAEGTGIVAKGTGMLAQPGTINLNIPAGASVEQVLLYWEGFGFSATYDDTITIGNGAVNADVTGMLIGGPDFFYADKYSSTFRADITDLGLVGPGANTLTLSGMDFSSANNGAGLLVIIDDGSGLAEIGLVDGNDLAFINFDPPRDTTVPQTFAFPSFSEDRTATLTMFFASVQGPASSGGPLRPTTIVIDVDGTVTLVNNQLGSFDGDEWDTLVATVTVPAGADNMTIQALSEDNEGTGALPASFVWSAAGLSILPGPSIEIEKFTNGYDADDADGFPIPTPPDGEFLVGLNQVPLVGVGDPITWTYKVKNTGSETLVNVMVSDSRDVTVVCPQDTLAGGEEMTCTATGTGLDLADTPGTVPGCDGAGQGQPRPAYENVGMVVGEGESSSIEVTDDDPSHYCNPEDPAIEIEKATNGVDADAPDGGDAPQIAPGDTVTWSYVVTNVGTVTLVDIQAFDDTLGVALECPKTTLEPGESMTCNAISDVAVQLDFGDPNVVPGTCGGIPGRPLYENMGRATGESEIGTFVEDDDPSHYCNPEEPAIDIEKATNGVDADAPNGGDVPQIAPGDTVTWSYVVTNIGTVRLVDIQAFDDTLGVTLDCPKTTLEPGESMMCNAISEMAVQLGFGDPNVVPGTCGGIPERPLYENIARATGESEIGTFVEDDDPSHYCNPEADFFGCTPGFWKNNTGAWAPTPYSPNQTITSVFNEAAPYVSNDKLIQGLQYGGGPGTAGAVRILLRAAIASLLNASHPAVDPGFPLSAMEVINSVNAALATGNRGVMLGLASSLDDDNNAGCPLDADESQSNDSRTGRRIAPESRSRTQTPGRTELKGLERR